MTVPRGVAARLKSFRDATLPCAISVLIGRNGSGKSNAIDGLHVLDRLAEGQGLREAIDDSRRQGGKVRGGVAGCLLRMTAQPNFPRGGQRGRLRVGR